MPSESTEAETESNEATGRRERSAASGFQFAGAFAGLEKTATGMVAMQASTSRIFPALEANKNVVSGAFAGLEKTAAGMVAMQASATRIFPALEANKNVVSGVFAGLGLSKLDLGTVATGFDRTNFRFAGGFDTGKLAASVLGFEASKLRRGAVAGFGQSEYFVGLASPVIAPHIFQTVADSVIGSSDPASSDFAENTGRTAAEVLSRANAQLDEYFQKLQVSDAVKYIAVALLAELVVVIVYTRSTPI